MYIVLNNINKENIIYEYRFDKTVLKYKLNDFIIIGIPLKIIYDEYIDMNYITKLFISDKNTLELLNNIDNNSNIYISARLLKYDDSKKKYYILCKNKNNKKLNDSVEYISIVKIYNDNYYNYII